MNPEDVGRLLDELGERIGPAGEYAWHLTVRQVIIDSALWGAVAVILLLASAVGLACYLRYRKQATIPGRAFTAIIVGELACLPAVIILATVGTHWLNPEYHAMIRLLERLTP